MQEENWGDIEKVFQNSKKRAFLYGKLIIILLRVFRLVIKYKFL